MKSQKKQLLIICVILVLCVAAYFAINRYAKNAAFSDDGPNAYMGDVTEAVIEDETETAIDEETENVTEDETETGASEP